MAKKSEARIAKERKRKAVAKRNKLMKMIAVWVLLGVLAVTVVLAFASTPR